MKELYAEHVAKIRTVFSEDVAKQLGVRNLQPKDIKQLLRSIKDILPTHML